MQAIKPSLWIVGSIGIDTITFCNERRTDLLGGSVTYACAAASFFAHAGAVGVVGEDFPETFLERYRRFGIALDGLQRLAGPTFHWEGAYDSNLIDRTTIKTELGVFERFKPELPPAFRDLPYLLLGNIGPELQLHLLDQVEGNPFVMTDTMNLWIEIARPALLEVLTRTTLLTINDSEARQLSGRHNLLECAKELLALGPQYVVIKKGEHGSLLFTAENLAIIPAYPVATLRDPTGAGDCYAGACLGYLAQQGRHDLATLRQALLYASAVASFGVESFSTDRLEQIDRAMIEARVAQLRTMARL